MKTYISISFRSALSLEELAHAIGLNPVEFDAENEDEWALGTLGPFDDIDIARSHLVQPAETRTSICRFKHGPDRGMPASFLQDIHVALKTVATEFEVHGTEHGQPFKVIGAAIDSLCMQPDTDKTTLASLAMRLRRITSLSPGTCKDLLAALPDEARLGYVEHYERSGQHFLIDPLELDPAAASLISAVRREARDLYERGEFGKGMGSGGNMHHWMQQELARRYDIHWRTPQQMNPSVAFD